MAATLFHAHPTSGVPIYRQLMDQVELLAASGRLPAGEFLPSVRQVAQELSINPMTVSKAYSLLERAGVVEHVRGTGVRMRQGRRERGLRDRVAELRPLLEQAAARARQLALPDDLVLEHLRTLLQEHDHG